LTIPFRDAAELEAGGNAAFLRITGGDRRRAAALLQVNGRGEPIEFTFNHLDLPSGPLWRPHDLAHWVARELTASLLQAAQRSPLVLLCLAREVPPGLFRDDLLVQLPVCRVATRDEMAGLDRGEVAEERRVTDETVHLFWRPAPAPPESPPRRLLESLVTRGLVLEPFERVLAGIHEALADQGS